MPGRFLLEEYFVKFYMTKCNSWVELREVIFLVNIMCSLGQDLGK